MTEPNPYSDQASITREASLRLADRDIELAQIAVTISELERDIQHMRDEVIFAEVCDGKNAEIRAAQAQMYLEAREDWREAAATLRRAKEQMLYGRVERDFDERTFKIELAILRAKGDE